MADLHQTFTQLDNLLVNQAEQILDIVRELPGSVKSPFVLLPNPSQIDYDSSAIVEYVAVTSNEFAKASRLAGICRALLKTTEGHYKHKYKVALGDSAKNQSEREANAHKATQAEYNKYVTVSALVELAESWEAATRIASESARRMLLTTEQLKVAENRVTTASNALQPANYNPW